LLRFFNLPAAPQPLFEMESILAFSRPLRNLVSVALAPAKIQAESHIGIWVPDVATVMPFVELAGAALIEGG
jgi:hypothetical protein